MYPKQHFISSTTVVLVYAIAAGVDGWTLLLWLSAAAAVTVGLDGDHFLVLLARKDFEHMRMVLGDPLRVLRNPKTVKREIYFHGFGGLRILTHTIIIIAAYLACKTMLPSLLTPISISLLVHLFLDCLDYAINPQDR